MSATRVPCVCPTTGNVLRSFSGHLRQHGAPTTCHVVGGPADGTGLPLAEAISEYVDYGALLICLPGQLALHLPEYDDPVVLERHDFPTTGYRPPD